MTRASRSADRPLFVAFLLCVVWLPLPVASNHLWSVSVFEVWVFAMALVWLLLFAAGRVAVTQAFRRAWLASLLFLGFCAWTALQLMPLPAALLDGLAPGAAEIHRSTGSVPVLSLDPAGTRVALLKTLAYGVLFALTLLLVTRRSRLRLLALTLVFSGVFQAGFGALMTLSGLEYGFFVDKLHGRGTVTGTFVNPNHLAGYLEMCMGLGVGLILADMSTTRAGDWREFVRRLLQTLLGDKARVRLALIIMVIGLVLSKSRMGNLAFFSSLLIAAAWFVLAGRRISMAMVAFFASVVLIDILIIGNLFGIERVAQELRQSSSATEAARIDVGRDTLTIIRAHPLTGTGAGSFASVYPMYDSGKVGFWYYRHAHNDYLQFASESGVPGLLMLAGIVVLGVWHATRAQLKRQDAVMRGLACGVFMAIVAMLIHAAVDFNLQIPANAATFVVLLAMAWHTRCLDRRSGRRRPAGAGLEERRATVGTPG